MNDRLQRVQDRARQLARSGKFNGWSAIAFKLQFEDGFTDAFGWLYGVSAQEELDGICREAGGT
jgi:hypothetical protein